VGIGTAINVLAVLAGGSIGTLAGARLPEGMRSTAMQAIGIVTLLVGVSHFLKFDNVLVPLLSVILGLVVGELLIIDARLRRLGNYLERRFSKGESPVSRDDEPPVLRWAADGDRLLPGWLERRLQPPRSQKRPRLYRGAGLRLRAGVSCSRPGRFSWIRDH
jgi:Protein of unknown function (DUF554)